MSENHEIDAGAVELDSMAPSPLLWRNPIWACTSSMAGLSGRREYNGFGGLAERKGGDCKVGTHLQALCGFGWMSDNSALQCIGGLNALDTVTQRLIPAVILPRVQTHFNLSHEVVGLLSACTMAGVSLPFAFEIQVDGR